MLNYIKTILFSTAIRCCQFVFVLFICTLLLFEKVVDTHFITYSLNILVSETVIAVSLSGLLLLMVKYNHRFEDMKGVQGLCTGF